MRSTPLQRLSQVTHRSTVTPSLPELGGEMRGRTVLATGCAVLLALAVPTAVAAADPSTDRHGGHDPQIGGFKHLVVIYEENHSFDNLYGTWGSMNGQQVVGLA